LCAALAKEGFNVLIIDADSQLSATAQFYPDSIKVGEGESCDDDDENDDNECRCACAGRGDFGLAPRWTRLARLNAANLQGSGQR
jgi:cellulose biosynthesis protein BcsQ